MVSKKFLFRAYFCCASLCVCLSIVRLDSTSTVVFSPLNYKNDATVTNPNRFAIQSGKLTTLISTSELNFKENGFYKADISFIKNHTIYLPSLEITSYLKKLAISK